MPALLLFLGLPKIFALVTRARWPGWFSAAMIMAAPVSIWWSGSIVGITGFVSAGCAALINATEKARSREWAKASIWVTIAIVFLARSPFQYQPWILVLTPPLLLMTIVPLLTPPHHVRRNLAVVSFVAVGSLALCALTIYETRDGFASLMATSYPGARRSSGGSVSFENLFGAPLLFNVSHMSFSSSNASEISSAFLILGVISLVLLLGDVRAATKAHRNAIWVLVVATAFWTIWSTINFGSFASRIPLISLVTAQRAASVVGVPATLLFGLVAPIARRSTIPYACVSGFLGFLLTGYAGNLLRKNIIEDLPNLQILISAAVVGIICFLLTRWPDVKWNYGLAVAFASLLMVNTNPIQVGLGDLQNSQIAVSLRKQRENVGTDNELWATDSWTSLDPLLRASGVRSLSGRQLAGPNKDVWSLIDPDQEYVYEWNRGGSFITFNWTDDEQAIISNPTTDVIMVSIDPCVLAKEFPDLTTVASTHPIDSVCLAPGSAGLAITDSSIEFGGTTHYLYTVER